MQLERASLVTCRSTSSTILRWHHGRSYLSRFHTSYINLRPLRMLWREYLRLQWNWWWFHSLYLRSRRSLLWRRWCWLEFMVFSFYRINHMMNMWRLNLVRNWSAIVFAAIYKFHLFSAWMHLGKVVFGGFLDRDSVIPMHWWRIWAPRWQRLSRVATVRTSASFILADATAIKMVINRPLLCRVWLLLLIVIMCLIAWTGCTITPRLCKFIIKYLVILVDWELFAVIKPPEIIVVTWAEKSYKVWSASLHVYWAWLLIWWSHISRWKFNMRCFNAVLIRR